MDRLTEERRSEARKAMRAGVSALCAEVSALRAGEAEVSHLRARVDALAVEARNVGVPPERLLIVLKRVTDHAALAHLGVWQRLMLTEQVVQWAITSYYPEKSL